MNTLILNQNQKQKEYDTNLKKLLGSNIFGTQNIEKYAGILKNKINKSSISYQREIRKGWDGRVSKLNKK